MVQFSHPAVRAPPPVAARAMHGPTGSHVVRRNMRSIAPELEDAPSPSVSRRTDRLALPQPRPTTRPPACSCTESLRADPARTLRMSEIFQSWSLEDFLAARSLFAVLAPSASTQPGGYLGLRCGARGAIRHSRVLHQQICPGTRLTPEASKPSNGRTDTFWMVQQSVHRSQVRVRSGRQDSKLRTEAAEMVNGASLGMASGACFEERRFAGGVTIEDLCLWAPRGPGHR